MSHTDNQTPPADEFSRAVDRMVDALDRQHTTQEPRHHSGLNDFLKHNPPKFDGKATPDRAESWIRGLEKIFRVMRCSEEEKLAYASFLLEDESEYWWDGMQQMMETNGEVITWNSFKTRFLEKYFPNSAKIERETEFLNLRQGGMTVQAYISRFEYLSRFYSQAMSEEWRCQRFEQGLRHELMKMIVPLEIKKFPALVEKAKKLEKIEVNPNRIMKVQKDKFPAKEQLRKPYLKPQQPIYGSVKCYECGGPHYRRECPKLSGKKNDAKKCFNCNKPGHFAYNCPENIVKIEPQQPSPSEEKPKAAGRVFAITGEDAAKPDDVSGKVGEV
ncbi:uncharacterized protein HKW66_Vig0151290 [Vigna angularis]|uniref:CCHC-type domain-containing protein n=1 Tax=Phaseolus angularis TaxID=3914 RepID=A0A8T0JU09_PHAAN|nr:uncharacterized protein LOC128193560 [Vigna angularis]KAG2384108.1 uncharacterized protein HKW66_Vig0151290 [Vigna angularis]